MANASEAVANALEAVANEFGAAPMGPLCRLYGRFAAEWTFVSSSGDLRLPDLPFVSSSGDLIWWLKKLRV